MEPRKFDFVEVTLEPEDYNKVKEVYRLHKEQASKIFDLSSTVSTDKEIMEYVKDKIEYDVVLLAIDTTNNKYAGVIILDEVKILDGTIINAGVHIIVNKAYWGKQSRDIINNCFSFLKNNMKPILRFEAAVPSNNYGVIKLLKDVGFKIEGTLKNKLVFKNKMCEPTKYNQLIYSRIGEY